MATRSRRSFLSTASVAVAASLPGCTLVSPAAASICKAAPYVPQPDCVEDRELLHLGVEFDQIISERDELWSRYLATTPGSAEARELEERCETLWPDSETAADGIMAIQPVTLAGLALWARVMLWRFDPTLRGVVAKPAPELDEYGVNEAYALAAAINRMTSHSAELGS